MAVSPHIKWSALVIVWRLQHMSPSVFGEMWLFTLQPVAPGIRPTCADLLVLWIIYLSPGPHCKGTLPRWAWLCCEHSLPFLLDAHLWVYDACLSVFTGTCLHCRWSRTWLKAGWRVMTPALPSWSHTLYSVSAFDLPQEACGNTQWSGAGWGKWHLLKTMFSSYVALAQKPEDGKQLS